MEVVLGKRNKIEAERFYLLQMLTDFAQRALIVVRILTRGTRARIQRGSRLRWAAQRSRVEVS